MKKILLFICLLYLNISFSQALLGKLNFGSSSTGVSGENIVALNLKNTSREVEGSVYLFDEWESTATIQLKDKKKYTISNGININLKTNTLEAKLSKDSVFVFDLENVRRLIVNKKTYVNYNYKNNDKILQRVYFKDKIEILKGYSVKFVEGSSNPMVNRPTDKYVRSVSYFYKKGDVIYPVKLKVKKIVKELEISKEKAKELIHAVKKK